jgi:hypothetical protein
VRQLFLARLLEVEYVRSLRIHPAEQVPYRAVLAASVERLQHHEKRLAVIRIEQILQLIHPLHVFCNVGRSLLTALIFALVGRIDLRQMNLRAGLDHEFFPKVHAEFFPLSLQRGLRLAGKDDSVHVGHSDRRGVDDRLAHASAGSPNGF